MFKYTSFVTGNCFSKCAIFLEAPSCHNCLGPTCPWGGSTEQLCADTRAGALLNSRGHHSRRQRCQKDPRERGNRYDEPRRPELKLASHAGSRVWQHELVSRGPSCSRTVSFLSQSSHPAQGLCCTRRSESEPPFSDGHQGHGLLLDSGPSPLSLYHHGWLQPSQVHPGISPYGRAALSSDQIQYNYPSTFPSSIKNFTLLS